MKKKIYLAIIQRLKSANLGIEHFSLWNNNIESLTTQKVFITPAVFIEFETIHWSQLLHGARSAEVRIHLHVVTQTLATPEDGGKYQDMSLEYLCLIEEVQRAIQGMSGEGFNSFMLIESISDHDHGEILHNDEVYITRITEALPRNTLKELTGPSLTTTVLE